MKVLFEGKNLSEEKAQEIFGHFITDDYSLLENISSENGDYAIFSDKETLLKVETKYCEETNLNHLKIIDLQKDNVEEELLKFEIISSKKLQNLKISHNQIITVIEALNKYNEYLSNIEDSTTVGRLRTDFEKEKVDVISNYLEDIINYNYDGACINCMNKILNSKKNDMMGLGASGFEQSAKIKKNKEGSQNDKKK